MSEILQDIYGLPEKFGGKVGWLQKKLKKILLSVIEPATDQRNATALQTNALRLQLYNTGS